MSSLFVVMGVAGSGKSLIGAALANSLDVDFVDGDDYHSAANIARMASGIPLTDDDRAAWLGTLGAMIRDAKDSGAGIVVACSALRRRYRDILRASAPELQFIFLNGAPTLIANRLADRGGHFMPASLLDSQLATLEEPTPDESAWVCDIRKSPEEIVAEIVARTSA
jgi:gluconokinase